MFSTQTILLMVAGVALRHFFPNLFKFMGASPASPSPSPVVPLPASPSAMDEFFRKLLSGQIVLGQGVNPSGVASDGTTHTVPLTLNVQTAVGRPSS